MARKTTTTKGTTARAKKTVEILADTAEAPAPVASVSNDMICIACGMPLGIKFDDVANGHGGFKTIKFPGVNHALRGKSKGILLPAGNAVLVRIARADWEDIKRKHGRERAFTAFPPLLWEMKDEAEFKARRDEIAEMRTGVEPVDPTKYGVEEAKEE